MLFSGKKNKLQIVTLMFKLYIEYKEIFNILFKTAKFCGNDFKNANR